MEKIKPSDILLIGISFRIINILFADTSSVHNLGTLPGSVETTILLLFVIAAGIPILWNSSTTNQNLLLTAAVLLSIAGSLLSIFNFSIDIIGYRIIVDLISICTIFALYKTNSNEGRIYVILFSVVLLDLQTILFTDLSVEWLVSIVGMLFETVFLAGLVYYIYKSKFSDVQLAIVAGLVLSSIGLSLFVLDRDTPLLIFRTVIEQQLGIREFAVDLILFEITNDTLFIIHVTEFIVLSAVIIFNRPPKLLLTLILCGFNLTYPPLGGFRAIAIMYYLNRSDDTIDNFIMVRRAPIDEVKLSDKEYDELIENSGKTSNAQEDMISEK